jgi:hypothetical protein
LVYPLHPTQAISAWFESGMVKVLLAQTWPEKIPAPVLNQGINSQRKLPVRQKVAATVKVRGFAFATVIR